MAESKTTPQVVRNYLSQLESALAGVPREVSRDILSGVREELLGLDAPAAAARIEELGDPAFIAAEARAEAGPAPVTRRGASDPLWYTVVASLLVAVGAIAVPAVGWIAGLAMVWFSRTWRTWEKWVATLATPAVAAIMALTALLVSLLSPASPNGSDRPLLFAPYDVLTSAMFLLLVVNVTVGIWLLWRARRARRVPN